MEDHANDVLAFRREVSRRFARAPVAMSADGRAAVFSGPLDLGVQPGAFAIAEPDHGPGIVVQIEDLEIVEHEGPELQLGDETMLDAPSDIRSAVFRPPIRSVAGRGSVLGLLDDEGFTASPSAGAFGELPLRRAGPTEIARIAGAINAGQATIVIGTRRGTVDVDAALRAKGFARHTFMCGQSGSGKTYTTGVLFERLLLETTLPLLILDPNSDHVGLGSVANPDDHTPLAERYREIASRVRVARARGQAGAGHWVLRINFSDLGRETQALLLRLDPVADLEDYNQFVQLAGTLPQPYTLAALARAAGASAETHRLAQRIENLDLLDWELWCRDGESSVADQDLTGLRAMVLDLGSLPTPAARTIVALALLRRRWQRRQERQATLLAIDEAHNVFPANTNDPLLGAANEVGALIAGEGRKFGLHLFLASQRPGKVLENVVSQCDNLLLMRMNGAGDVEDLCRLFSHVPAAMIRSSVGFGLGEALVAGHLSPVPVTARIGTRLSPEGGGDVPTTWAAPDGS